MRDMDGKRIKINRNLEDFSDLVYVNSHGLEKCHSASFFFKYFSTNSNLRPAGVYILYKLLLKCHLNVILRKQRASSSKPGRHFI